jgi:hypothetical protein
MKTILSSFVFFALISISCQSPKNEPEEQPAQPAADPVAVSPDSRLANIKTELKAVKSELTAAGKYNCCVQPACDWCALKEGECPCHDNLLAKKVVCPDCGLGWHNGLGVVKGVKVSQVKWDITHQHAGAQHQH